MSWEEIPEINIFTDGGAEPNPGKGGFGVMMTYKGHKKEFSQGYLLTTNNRMELMGVIFGLEKLKTKSIVNIYTDSRYVVDGITKGWAEKWKSKNWYRTKNEKAVNHDLWDRLLTLISTQHQVTFHWIKGHDGHFENERCDQIANSALNGSDLLEDSGYEPKEERAVSSEEKGTTNYPGASKIEQEGDQCRKCGTPVIKRQPKQKPLKPGQNYYFEFYLLCPNCKTMYMVEEAKRYNEVRCNDLFS